ncbi:hypothetical protein D3C79_864920 [compost metagenome]
MAGQAQLCLAAERAQVLVDGKRCLVAAVNDGDIDRGQRRSPGLTGRSVPPLQLDRGQLVVTCGGYHIAHAVFTLATVRAPSAITERRNTGGLHIAFEAFDLHQWRRRYQHRLGALGTRQHPAGNAVTCTQR